ncbi:hypothetical protein JB92DRAFT_2980856 [Gautieria morchelliformis]|nr:hypothetical protein JB92DRAFT_2980856 [Gautieria morchelliformis]
MTLENVYIVCSHSTFVAVHKNEPYHVSHYTANWAHALGLRASLFSKRTATSSTSVEVHPSGIRHADTIIMVVGTANELYLSRNDTPNSGFTALTVTGGAHHL